MSVSDIAARFRMWTRGPAPAALATASAPVEPVAERMEFSIEPPTETGGPVAATSTHSFDWPLLSVVFALVGIGMVMVYSSSTVIGAAKFGSSGFFVLNQSVRVAIGLLVLWATAYKLRVGPLQKVSPIILALAVLLLPVPLIAGAEYKGACRWIHFYGLTFQPSELARFAVVLFLADRLSSQQKRLSSFVHGLLPHVLILVIVLTLIVVEPDLSTTIAIALIAGAIMLVAGVRARHLLLLAGVAAVMVIVLVIAEPYRVARLTGFLRLFGDTHSPSYQIQQGFVALGSGGLFGRGLGQSLQKYFFLPEPYTDSIFPVIGEEFGVFGALGVVEIALHHLRPANHNHAWLVGG